MRIIHTTEDFYKLSNGVYIPKNEIKSLHDKTLFECTRCIFDFFRKPYVIFRQGPEKFCICCNKINAITDYDGSCVLSDIKNTVKSYKGILIFIPEYKNEEMLSEKGNPLKSDLAIFLIDNLSLPLAIIEIGKVCDINSYKCKRNFCYKHGIVFQRMLYTNQCDYYFRLFIERLLEFNRMNYLDKNSEIEKWFPSIWINDIRDK